MQFCLQYVVERMVKVLNTDVKSNQLREIDNGTLLLKKNYRYTEFSVVST